MVELNKLELEQTTDGQTASLQNYMTECLLCDKKKSKVAKVTIRAVDVVSDSDSEMHASTATFYRVHGVGTCVAIVSVKLCSLEARTRKTHGQLTQTNSQHLALVFMLIPGFLTTFVSNLNMLVYCVCIGAKFTQWGGEAGKRVAEVVVETEN